MLVARNNGNSKCMAGRQPFVIVSRAKSLRSQGNMVVVEPWNVGSPSYTSDRQKAREGSCRRRQEYPTGYATRTTFLSSTTALIKGSVYNQFN